MVLIPRLWPYILVTSTLVTFSFVYHFDQFYELRSFASKVPVKVPSVATSIATPGFNDHRPLHIALVNTQWYHFEVVTPLLHALGSHRYSHLELFATRHGIRRHGALPIVHQQVAPEYLSHSDGKLSIKEPHALRASPDYHDVVVFTTCSRDLEYFDQDDFLNPSHPRSPREILCVLHEGWEWSDDHTAYREIVQPWINAGRISFVGLSQHVSSYFRKSLVNEWHVSAKTIDAFDDVEVTSHGWLHDHKNYSTRVVTFPPVYEPKDVKGDKDKEWISDVPPTFGAIQGKFESDRRNYGVVLDTVAKNTYQLHAHHASLRLLGAGNSPPIIPEALKSLVHLHSGLPFPAYYSLLSRANAIIPAFAKDLYYVNQASSTIAASIIAGIPPIASEQLLASYAYLDREAAWMKHDNETEVETWVRVVDMGKDAWDQKKLKVKARRKALVDANIALMGRMLDMVRRRIERDEQEWKV